MVLEAGLQMGADVSLRRGVVSMTLLLIQESTGKKETMKVLSLDVRHHHGRVAELNTVSC
jgi:hypothetical protein